MKYFSFTIPLIFLFCVCQSRDKNLQTDVQKHQDSVSVKISAQRLLSNDTIFLLEKWKTDDYEEDVKNNRRHYSKAFEYGKDKFLIKHVEHEVEGSPLSPVYSEREIVINGQSINLDKEFSKSRKHDLFESFTFLPRNIAIHKEKDNGYYFYLIMYDNICAVDCYNVLLIKVIVSNKGNKVEFVDGDLRKDIKI